MIKNARIVCKDANPLDYHKPQDAKRGDGDFVMSNSALSNFASCPARFLAGYESPDSDAKRWGNLIDCAFLTPDLFGSRYVVQPEKYETTGMVCPKCGSVTDSKKCANCKCDRIPKLIEKDWHNTARECAAWITKQAGKVIIQAHELADVETATKRLLADETIANFHAQSDKQVWLAGEWHDHDTGIVVPLRGLLDLAPCKESEFSDCIADLKSTRNAALIPWQRWCYQAKYHWQGALYLDLWNAAADEGRTTFCFIVQENYAPWQTSKKILGQDGSTAPGFVTLGRMEYQTALKAYCQCRKRGFWPGYDDHDEAVQGWSVVRPDPWMAERTAFAPKFEIPGEEPPPDPTQDPEFDGRH